MHNQLSVSHKRYQHSVKWQNLFWGTTGLCINFLTEKDYKKSIMLKITMKISSPSALPGRYKMYKSTE